MRGTGPAPKKPLLTADQVRQAAQTGMEIGSHGLEHVSLPEADDTRLSAETARSRAILQELLGQQIRGFCYPYGTLGRSCRGRRCRTAGYDYACAVRPSAAIGRHAIPRTYVHDRDSSWRLDAKRIRLRPDRRQPHRRTAIPEWSMMRVAVVGQGYVGLPLSVRAAQVGHQVVAYDVDETRVKRLLAGESYIEDVSDQHLSALLEAGTLHPSSEARACAGFDVAVITVPTPLREGAPDLRYIEEAARTLARYLRPAATVILESTTYPGTTEELVAPILEDGSGLTAGVDFHLGYSPERIDPGNPTWTFVNTPKVVSGIDAASLAAVQAFYDTVVDKTVAGGFARGRPSWPSCWRTPSGTSTSRWSTSSRCSPTSSTSTSGRRSTPRRRSRSGSCGSRPGPGVGGHCLPIDPSYLSWRVERVLGQSFRFVELANDINDHMPDYVVRRLTMASQRPAAGGQRLPHPAARSGVQEEHRRRSRVARGARRAASGRDGRRGTRCRPTHRGGHPRRRSAVSRRCDPGGAGVCRCRRFADRPRRVRFRRHRRSRRVHSRLPSSFERASCGVPVTTAIRGSDRRGRSR